MLLNSNLFVYANGTLEGGTNAATKITNYTENITIKSTETNQCLYKFIPQIGGNCTITMENTRVKWQFYIYDKDANIVEVGQGISTNVNSEKQNQTINVEIGNINVEEVYYLEIGNTDYKAPDFTSDIYILASTSRPNIHLDI